MARIYVSSTYADLKLFREASYRALRQLGHDVIAMEDYGAVDSRPLDKCLGDVASCAVYVGLIGDRYGYIPTESNPEGKSITELEYRAATLSGKQRLIFIYKGNADREFADAFTRQGDGGRLVEAFKEQLRKQHMVSEFGTPEELAQKVTVAVATAFREPADQGATGATADSRSAAPEDPELEALRDSARTILKLYGAKSIHDILHDIYLRARVLRAEDPRQVDGRNLSDIASYCAPKMTNIAEEVAQCDHVLEDSDRGWVKAHREPLEKAIAGLRTTAGGADTEARAAAVTDFNERLITWLSDLDSLLRDFAEQLDGDKMRAVIAKLKDRYATQLEAVERNLQNLMGDVNPMLGKCRALLAEHHDLQSVHDKLPFLFVRLATDDPQVAAGEWKRLKRRLSTAQTSWKRFGELPSGGANWEEDVRDGSSWEDIDGCIRDLDGILVTETPASDGTSKAVRPLAKLQACVEDHFKLVDQALVEGFRLFKVGIGDPIMKI